MKKRTIALTAVMSLLMLFFSGCSGTPKTTVDNSEADIKDALTSNASEQQSKSESSKSESTEQASAEKPDNESSLSIEEIKELYDNRSDPDADSKLQEINENNTSSFAALKSRMIQTFHYKESGNDVSLLEQLFNDYPDISDEKYNEIIQNGKNKDGNYQRYPYDEAVILGLKSGDEPNITLDEVRTICANAADKEGYERNNYIINEIEKIHLPEAVSSNNNTARYYKLDPEGDINREICVLTFARSADITVTYYTYNNGESRHTHLTEETLFSTAEQ